MREDAVSNGSCRFCRRRIPTDWPRGVLPPGTLVGGHYLLGYYLGKGGFGITYRALELNSRRMVAIKEFYPDKWCERRVDSKSVSIISQEFDYGKKHFLGEAEILKSLIGIPEVVDFYESFEENNTAYYVMEFLDGMSLRDYLRSRGERISYAETLRILMPVILALQRVHETKTLHRDLSPNNILLCRDGSVELIDFGASSSASSRYAETFMPVKTEGFSPPEQHVVDRQGNTQGPWSDIYAMTGTIYRCVIGENPPTASSRQAGEELEFGSGILSRDQIAVLRKGLALDRRQRYQSMLELAAALTGCLHGSEREAFLSKYPQLRGGSRSVPIPPRPPETVTSPRSDSTAVPDSHSGIQQEEEPLTARRVLAWCADMLLFLGIFALIWTQTGYSIWMWLAVGTGFGWLVTWIMTASKAAASPGQLLCGLTVRSDNGGRPGAAEALLYSLMRMLWPLAPVSLICLLTKKRDLAELVGSCRVGLRQKVQSSASGPTDKRTPNPSAHRSPLLVITDGLYKDSVITLEPGEYRFGRNDRECNLVFPAENTDISRVHLLLVVDEQGRVFATDLSTNGTWLNGSRMQKNMPVQVPGGSSISFGKERMLIR